MVHDVASPLIPLQYLTAGRRTQPISGGQKKKLSHKFLQETSHLQLLKWFHGKQQLTTILYRLNFYYETGI